MTTGAHLSGPTARQQSRTTPATLQTTPAALPTTPARPSAFARLRRLFTPCTLSAEDLVFTEADIAADLAYGRDD